MKGCECHINLLRALEGIYSVTSYDTKITKTNKNVSIWIFFFLQQFPSTYVGV